MDELALITLVVAAITLVGVYRSLKAPKGLPLPPGPPGLPIIGNVLDLPKNQEWVQYRNWGRKYGDIISLNLLGQRLIVLNTAETASELMDKRGANYSDRPSVPMVTELMGWHWNFVLMNYGSEWRERRRMFYQHFHPATPHRLVSVRASHSLVNQLVKDTDTRAHNERLRHFAGSIIMMIVYGYMPKIRNDPMIKLVEEASATSTSATRPGAFLVNAFPALMSWPEWAGATFKTQAREWKKLAENLVDIPFDMVREKMKEGKAVSSFVTANLESRSAEQEQKIKDTAAVAYAAAADTTVATLSVFLLAMTMYPDVQRKAQSEIDKLLSEEGRLPDHGDMKTLPYVDCIIKETLRWLPAAPFGVPHQCREEDEYKGYRIPAGAAVIGNSWAILHDEKVYPEPEEFIPERYLDNPQLQTPFGTSAAFGYGRRICAGSELAYDTLWIAYTTILATCNITKARDANGKYVIPAIGVHPGLITHPLPFDCVIRPRSAAAIQLLRNAEASTI